MRMMQKRVHSAALSTMSNPSASIAVTLSLVQRSALCKRESLSQVERKAVCIHEVNAICTVSNHDTLHELAAVKLCSSPYIAGMTVTSSRVLERGSVADSANVKKDPKPPPRTWYAAEPPFKGYQPSLSEGYQRATKESVIVIDNGENAIEASAIFPQLTSRKGSSLTRAGWSFDKSPRICFPPDVARYRDRKFNKAVSYVGYSAYADATTRGQIKKAFEPGSSIVGNWDVMEGVLDRIFVDLGISSEGGVDKPILMTEPLANLGYTRRSKDALLQFSVLRKSAHKGTAMTELIFECYGAPSLAYGIDSLFSFKYNQGTTGLVISSSNSSTHVIPVLNSKALMSSVSRLNWGGSQSAEYLLKLLRLKYPIFTGKLTDWQGEQMVREHCYVSQDFDQEISTFLDWAGLEERDHIIQYPYTEHVIAEKSEEELARIAERKRQGGIRLQEQAAKMRLEKLVRKEQELEYFKDLQKRLVGQTKKEIKRLLDDDEFRDEAQLEKTVRDMEKAVRKARNKDLGNDEPQEEEAAQSFPLLDVPDEELDEAGLKQKRHQRLMKSGVEARARAKLEKEQEKARRAEVERLDNERRENHLDEWLANRRTARNVSPFILFSPLNLPLLHRSLYLSAPPPLLFPAPSSH